MTDTKLLLDHPEAKFILELRQLPKGPLFIDIGANAGYYAINLADRYREVWAVEPCTVFVDMLRRNIETFGISNIRVIEKAVSDTTGRAAFYGNQYVLFGRDNPSLKQDLVLSYEGREKRLPLHFTDVDTITIPDLLHGRIASLIKVDTEGNEKNVLYGSRYVMNQINAWHVEVHDWRDVLPIRRGLKSYGYTVRERGMDSRGKGWLLATAS